MGLIQQTPTSLQPLGVHRARAVSSSEAAALQGKPAKTPIIAASISAGLVLIAWIIGFAIYFRKRYNRKKLKRAAVAAGMPPPEVKSKTQTEEVIIPPDPAVLLGQRKPGYAFAELAPPPEAVAAAEKAEKGKGVSCPIATRERHIEEKRPLLSVMTDMPDVSMLERRRPGENGEKEDGDGDGDDESDKR